jgi:hypothetical protein
MTFFGSRKQKAKITKQIVEQQVQSTPSTRLKEFVPNDEKMYIAMQNFLLADPERQVPMLGESDALIAKGEAASAKGDKLVARISYETAAKIEIYKQNKENAEKCIRLANELTESNDLHRASYEAMLGNMDEVLRISKLYSNSVSRKKA